ncbi:hypothetical protein CH63R_14429 [Colletotrichum higginsianum IMI 349063]|uniref:Uncharacterized protein n=1 Tax=Colletotrichum higginsianum (strain IMI 349063) TaxID=759273 RepID=A0A1B7XQU2_COLHI|nr:hypothetical protein CH63R_14429 [Colletotrichum higginsianum IMI 349063]OBR02128.1 hypothetical protein CH63R_14429 [Colletotrichum higginsianum IMI 349063]
MTSWALQSRPRRIYQTCLIRPTKKNQFGLARLLAAHRTPTPAGAGKDNPTPGPSRPAAPGNFEWPIAIGSTPTAEPPGPPSKPAENDDEVDIVPDDEEEEGPRRIVEAAKSSQALNDIIRTPDDSAFGHNTADYFHLPVENFGSDNGITLLGTRMSARPQQYLDT